MGLTKNVDYPTAKLLKEKGFDLPCRFLYKSEEEGWEEGIGVDYNWNSFESCSAPTIAETIMWLYEKHGIWIEVRKSYLLDKFVAVTKSPRVELSTKDTPTEAYQEAIAYILKNLIK